MVSQEMFLFIFVVFFFNQFFSTTAFSSKSIGNPIILPDDLLRIPPQHLTSIAYGDQRKNGAIPYATPQRPQQGKNKEPIYTVMLPHQTPHIDSPLTGQSLVVAKDLRRKVHPGSSTTTSSKTTPSTQVHNNARISMQEFYDEWIMLLMEEMKGSEWVALNPSQRKIDKCINNLKLKNMGCAFLIPTCKKYDVADTDVTYSGWSCEMTVWSSCTCSTPYRSFLKYLVPPAFQCYGMVLHSYDLTALLGVSLQATDTTDSSHMALIPLGYCGWSGFFLFYIVVLCCAMILLWGVLRNSFLRRIQQHKKKLSDTASVAVLESTASMHS